MSQRNAKITVLAGAGFLLASAVGCSVDVYGPPPPREVVVTNAPPPEPEPETVVADTEPPPPQVEVEGVAPGPDYVFVGGEWGWEGGRWRWHGGHWDHPPHRGGVWVRGGWHRGPHGFVHDRGHWR